jgi:hypothetical protein
MTTVVICASLGHPDLIAAAVADLSGPGVTVHAPQAGRWPEPAMARLAWHGLIDTCDLVVAIAKPGGDIGNAVRDELHHAVFCARKPLRWWKPAEPLAYPETGEAV